ncbi:MAG TPA: DUF1801 domain-containing protein [Thermoplasmata archaeon]|nr:DUF1801 domain-containing protein [Thermoplasmata archaeon]
MAPTAGRDVRARAAIDGLDRDLRPIGRQLLRLIRTHAPGLQERFLWGNPVWSGRSNAIYLMLHRDHINLGFFRGAELAPRFPEIEGTGKSLRHVKVRSLKDAERASLARMIRAAAALDRTGS